MYTFLVLGIVPGTNIAISFQAWLDILAILACLALVYRKPLRRLWESSKQAIRRPLPASQLHLRTRPTAR
jgi:hypothetical protein